MKINQSILIIDDTVDTVELLTKRLRADGYITHGAYDGFQGLKSVKEHNPDLVVLDVMMPLLDGFEVCNRLKSDPETRNIPILLLTAKSEIPDKVRGFDFGADGYITKPFDYKEVSAKIRSLLAKSLETRRTAEEEKNEALETLVDEISHEIRNPLVAIGGFARRVQKNLDEDDPNKKYLNIILQNVEVLEKMVTALVGLKSAALSLFELTDIHNVIGKAIDLNSEKIDQGGITIHTDFIETCPQVQADSENLTRALSNIIENSIEAMSGATRTLDIRTQIQEGNLLIRICDTGKGISRERLKNIYDPFVSSKIYGPGLGLTFVLKTIKNHKGSIKVESEEGKGTCFSIRLPLPDAS
ncbi:MAG: response regulator [Proteobacteria bacterium]|nr:response regulator [Pseudomonadota bacterium]MBU1709185.1 response regulator [Pseudomonadota bacterium]